MTNTIESADLVRIQEIADGEASKFFASAFERAVLNAVDPSTSHKAKRGLTIKFSFKPEQDRNMVAIAISCTPRIAGEKPKTTKIMVGQRSGAVAASEFQKVPDANAPVKYEESGYKSVTSYVSLSSLGGGVIPERWAQAMEEVVYNILDPNTDPEEARSITVILAFTPTEERGMANGHVSVVTKLAPLKPIPFSLNFSHVEGTVLGVREHRLEQTSLPV
ncbi:MAG: hypothetical protein QNJ46_05995 [Leptolyngbyaceae cyanobacterium MO_188.B28]|nr:hypothetical protein [Leptolyngbyaceae cyanobacterium MO_188.B28]